MEDRQFMFGSICWQEVHNKVEILPLMYLLNDQIDLAKYGQDLEIVYFVFIAVPPESHRHKSHFRYTRANKTLSAYQRIDFDKIKFASENQALRLLGECFLETMQQLRRRKLPDFDTEAFLADLKQLLEKEYLMKLVA